MPGMYTFHKVFFFTIKTVRDRMIKRGDNMKNIPVFSSEYGVGSLILQQIPYKGIAYVRIESSQTPCEFIEECVRFCRMAGAEKVYACGHSYLENYPLHTAIFKMTCSADILPDTDASVMPVTEATIEKWLSIYNERMKDVDNAMFKSTADGRELLEKGNGYFVHRDGTLLGIGIAANDSLNAVASVLPGAGYDVVLALTHALFCEQITLEVASTNLRAIALYERLGFVKTAEQSRWYKIS